MIAVWVQQRPNGDVTIYASGPRPRCKGDTLRETLHNGEEATEVVHANGEVHSVWFKAVIND